MRPKKLQVAYEYAAPKPAMVTYQGVRFELPAELAVFYRMAEFAGRVESFLREMEPWFWDRYMKAKNERDQEIERELERRQHDAEQKKLREREKSRLKRLRRKENSLAANKTAFKNNETVQNLNDKKDYITYEQ